MKQIVHSSSSTLARSPARAVASRIAVPRVWSPHPVPGFARRRVLEYGSYVMVTVKPPRGEGGSK